MKVSNVATDFVAVSEQKVKQSSVEHSFQETLHETMHQSEQTENQNEMVTTKSVETKGEGEQSKDEITEQKMESIKEKIEEFLQHFPLEAGFLKSDMLHHTDVQKLIIKLPKDTQKLLHFVINQGFSIEQAIDKTSKNGLALQTLLSIFTEQMKQTKGFETKFLSFLQQLSKGDQKQLADWFKSSFSKRLHLFGEKGIEQTVRSFSKTTDTKSVFDKFTTVTMGKQDTRATQQEVTSKQKAIGFQSGFMNPSQQLSFFAQLKQPVQPATSQKLVQQFTQMMQRGVFQTLPNGAQSFSIQLYPEHLGQMEVQLIRGNQEMMARLIVGNKQAKELIESQFHQLRQAIHQQNIQVDKWEVVIDEKQAMMQSNANQEQQERQSSDNKETNKENQKEENSFVNSFMDFLLQSEQEGE
ncbi:flagellar hook-length control protein FliK [Massilibacterium senegalense]|uniref:flagellar hook-length control protein FliK n=1 Tax=Massilibacterium senegalense TaxID=1632858 RepID=UPI000781641D|nr:flagellar hook-length control protein FliK [Massilibacterium senegalense]